jgi:antitoxin component YwqK of YwqJK toxin-antitoxin module
MKKYGLMALLCLMSVSCAKNSGKEGQIVSMRLVDRNGIEETISNDVRLTKLERANYLDSQPYQKVVRVYARDQVGQLHAKVTTYHDNGGIWQYLETVNGRAKGEYKEWFPNGELHMLAHVIEGVGDLCPEAEVSWVFDKKSKVWDEAGRLIAEIEYERGLLTNQSTYYHPNGVISKIIPYSKGKMDGVLKIFTPNGEIIGTTSYEEGKKGGLSIFMGNSDFPKREEEFKDGKLISGKYWDFRGNVIAQVLDGKGVKPVFENGLLRAEQEYKMGVPMGKVMLYRENGTLESVYSIIDNQKQGEEWCYYDRQKEGETLQPMLHINWKEDEIHGLVRSWYLNGTLECEKEMLRNKKQGTLIAWYEDGALMMVEEYENDTLLKGKYFKRGDENPISRVIDGKGIATIYDKDGEFVRKIDYEKGWPAD